jgi:MSHA biogenesis protein MshK
MGPARAQIVNDPTRPPREFTAGDAGGAGGAGRGIMLQSVLISPTQQAAIINGVMVRLGERYGDAVLIQVAEGEVVLKSGAARQVLKLHPGVEKRLHRDVEQRELASDGEKDAPRRGKTRGKAASR